MLSAAGVIAPAVTVAICAMPPSDLDSLGALMNGPGHASSTVAELGIDADSDGDFDLWDFAEVQTGARPDGEEEGGVAFGPLYATQCSSGNKYCRISKPVSQPTGAGASIRTRDTTLCGEAQSEAAVAGSLAWVGVVYRENGIGIKWAQVGYARTRKKIDGTKTVYRRPFAETQGSGQPGQGEYKFFSPAEPGLLSGVREYECYLVLPNLGRWRYNYDGSFYREYTAAGWANLQGNYCDYEAEIWNTKDQMVGTAAAKCDWTSCRQLLNNGDWEDTAFTAQDVHTDDANEWGIEYLSATSFQVWDKNP